MPLLKTTLSQPIGRPITVIVEFSIDDADPATGLMEDCAVIDSVLIHNTKFYIEELLSEIILVDLTFECVKYYQEELK